MAEDQELLIQQIIFLLEQLVFMVNRMNLTLEVYWWMQIFFSRGEGTANNQ